MVPGRLRYALPFTRACLRSFRRVPLPTSTAKPLIIVTGAGRSGTSAVARLLHESGLSMGGPFVETSGTNPAGFYEDSAIVRLHEALLGQLGMGEFLQSERWPWRTTVLAVASGSSDAMQHELARTTAGWKDPRFSLTLEAWLPLLPRRPKIVVCLRSPKSYADSVAQIYGFIDFAEAERHWARQYRRLLDVIRDYKLDAICVEYDALIEHPNETVAAISQFVGQPLDPGLLERGLRHHISKVRAEYLPLYEEVLALSPQLPRVRSGATGRSAYLTAVRELTDRILAARRDWLSAIGNPEPQIESSFAADAITRTRDASSTYANVARDVQAALQRLDPPPEFEDYHERTRTLFDYERLTAAAFALAASADPVGGDTLTTALDCWRRFSSPAQFDRRLSARDGS